MSKKKVVIKENKLDETEEPSQETTEENEPTETPTTAPRQRQQLQKAEGRTRMRELYKCDFCNKFLTKKHWITVTLNTVKDNSQKNKRSHRMKNRRKK